MFSERLDPQEIREQIQTGDMVEDLRSHEVGTFIGEDRNDRWWEYKIQLPGRVVTRPYEELRFHPYFLREDRRCKHTVNDFS